MSKRSGLLERPEALAESEVAEILRDEPKLADLWMQRGGDQRFVGG